MLRGFAAVSRPTPPPANVVQRMAAMMRTSNGSSRRLSPFLRGLAGIAACIRLLTTPAWAQDNPVPVETVREFADRSASALALGALGLQSWLGFQEQVSAGRVSHPTATITGQGTTIEIFGEQANWNPPGTDAE